MALINMPRGLTPVGTLTGAAYNEQGRMYYLPNDASNTYAIGDIVGIAQGGDANGVPAVTKYATGAAPLPLGVIVGIRVADPGVSLVGADLALSKTYLNKSAGNHYVYVVDDPNVVFMIQSDSTGVTRNQLHNLATATITADQTSSLAAYAPFSNTVLTGPTTTNTVYSSANNTLFQIVGAPQDPVTQGALGAVSASTAVPYLPVLVAWNQHQYKIVNAVGA